MPQSFKPNLFEGFLLGVLVTTLFLAYNYGWNFHFIKEGHYFGPSHIYGVSALQVVIYVFIVFVLYEVVMNKSAIQSGIYTLTGYFFLDSVLQAYYGFEVYYPSHLYGDVTLANTVFNVMRNPDFVLLYCLIVFLVFFHCSQTMGTINRVLKRVGASIDCTFYFDLKRLVFFFALSALIYYYVSVPLWFRGYDYPAFPSLCLPLCAYVLSSKQVVGWFK